MMVKLCMILLCTVSSAFCYYTINESSQILHSLRIKDYSKHVTPKSHGDRPLNITAQIFFYSLAPLRPRYYELEIDLVLNWEDERLSFNTSKDQPIALVGKSCGHVWTPDIWIENEAAGKSEFDDIKFVMVYKSGRVLQALRLRLQMFCAMNYWVFPFDIQKCEVTLQSFAYNNKQLRLNWRESSDLEDIINFEIHFTASEYTVLKKNISKNIINYGVTGDFDQLIVTMEFERDAVYFIIQHFLPINLNIMLSMTSFWIDYTCVKARVTIPLVVVLTLTKQTMALKAILPFSNQPASLEYYLNFSIFFVFLVLLEYCMVELSKIKAVKDGMLFEEMEQKTDKRTVVGYSSHVIPEETNRSGFYPVEEENSESSVEHFVDRKARVIFPVMFVSYNVLYFLLLIINQKK